MNRSLAFALLLSLSQFSYADILGVEDAQMIIIAMKQLN